MGANGEAEPPRWEAGSYADFLGLTADERMIVELRSAVAAAIRDARTAAGLSQAALARRIGSGQSRVAKAEAGTTEVSLDLMFHALFAAGATLDDLARVVREAAESDRRFEAMKEGPALPAAAPTKKSRRKAIGA
jgi:transcriptional regulator with XRE-family HTH domain